MRLYLLSAFLLLFVPSLSIGQVRSEGDKLVRESQVSYAITHEDKTTEKVVVKYEAFLYSKVWQTGEASKPLEGHPHDDRTCHYTTNARVFRRAYVLTHAGIQAPVEEYQAVYQARFDDKRGPDNFFEALTYHETCGDVGLFANRISGAESALIAQFDDLIAQDDDKARERLREMLVGSKIERLKGP